MNKDWVLELQQITEFVHEEKNKFMTSSKERIAGLEAWVCVM